MTGDAAERERTDSEDGGREIVLVTRPAGPQPPHPIDTLREVLSSSVGMAAYTATTLASLLEQTVAYAVTSSVNAALDRLVPAIADAIIERLDLTDLVLERVDLERIVKYCERDVVTVAQVFLRLRNEGLLREDQIVHV